MVFELVHSVVGDGDIEIKKYISSDTGLSVFIAQIAGPIVNGSIAVATEALDDSGLPHTLEHLCFMGSEDYPFKGVLDILANRCLTDGVNAYTDVDHTCFTVSTAGPDGFLALLPIYLDHIFYPTLKDSAFKTEVHHIDGEGKDAGVVYCEMQSCENEGENRCDFAFLREIYPGQCGYKSNTGGLLKEIRESLSNSKIRQFHKTFYRPENVGICITGQISDEAILCAISKYEVKLIAKRKQEPPPPFVRPWRSPVSPFTESVVKEIQFPCDDDDNGIVLIGWRGPGIADTETTTQLSFLADYLCDSVVSPLQKAFVEIEDPYCSDVCCYFLLRGAPCIQFKFDSARKSKIDQVAAHFFQVLQSIAISPEIFDITRMKNVLHRGKMQVLSSLETYPDGHVSSAFTTSFLYDTDESAIDARVCQIPSIERLKEKDAHFWCQLIKDYFLSLPSVTIIGKPSPTLQKSLAKEEEARIKAQKLKLGPQLEMKAQQLTDAIAENSIAVPNEILSSFPVPSTENISFHSVERLTIQDTPEIAVVPFRIHVDHFATNFVTFHVLLNTAPSSICGENLDDGLRLYLPLFCQLFAESAIKRDGLVVPHEQVVAQLNADTIDCCAGLGGLETLSITLKVERENYLRGIKWLRELIFQPVFQVERVTVVVARMLNDLAVNKRQGDCIVREMMENLRFDSRSNDWASLTHRQINFLRKVSFKLKNDPSPVINDLNRLNAFFESIENIIVHFSMDKNKTSEVNGNIDLFKPWVEVFLPEKIRKSTNCRVITRPILKKCDLLSQAKSEGVVTGIGSTESNYLSTSVRVAINETHPHLPALMVLIGYLEQAEGPIYREVRGKGLSYGYSIGLSVDENLLTYELDMSAQLDEAYKVSRTIVTDHLSNKVEWNEKLLEASRATVMFQIIGKEDSLASTSHRSLFKHLLDLDVNYDKDFLVKVSEVTMKDIIAIAPIYLGPLFDPHKICKSVVCNPSKVSEMRKKFQLLKINLRQIDLEKELRYSHLEVKKNYSSCSFS